MKLNVLFLLIGLVLSAISKVYHIKLKSQTYIGHILVIPAAVCLCLALLFSLSKFNGWAEAMPAKAIFVAVSACGALVSFQIMMILLVGNKDFRGFYLLIPFLLLLGAFLKLWFA